MRMKVLGIMLTRHLTFSKYCSEVAQSCIYYAQAIYHIGHLLMMDFAQMLACSVILYRSPGTTAAKLCYTALQPTLYGSCSVAEQRIWNYWANSMGHSGPLCHALSFLSSSSSWTSMHRRRVATPGEWQCKTARSGEWAQHFSNASCSPAPRRFNASLFWAHCTDWLFSKESTTKWFCWCSRSAARRCRPTSIVCSRREDVHSIWHRSSTSMLCWLFTKMIAAKRAFRCTAPAIWVLLQKIVVDSDAATSFKSRIVTHLFCQAFSIYLFKPFTDACNFTYNKVSK